MLEIQMIFPNIYDIIAKSKNGLSEAHLKIRRHLLIPILFRSLSDSNQRQ